MDKANPLNNAKMDAPCRCTFDLIETAKVRKQALPGLACVITAGGDQVVGVVILTPPVLVGSRPKHGIATFNFCPWCGKRLARAEVKAIEDVEGKTN